MIVKAVLATHTSVAFRSSLQRSMSDGVLIYESSSSSPSDDVSNYHQTLPNVKESGSGMSDSSPDISACDSSNPNVSYTG